MAIERFPVDAASAGVSYPTNPQAAIPFQPKKISVVANDNDCYVSLDGVNDHVYLPGNGASYDFVQRVKNVWLRQGTVAAHTNIQVIAES